MFSYSLTISLGRITQGKTKFTHFLWYFAGNSRSIEATSEVATIPHSDKKFKRNAEKRNKHRIFHAERRLAQLYNQREEQDEIHNIKEMDTTDDTHDEMTNKKSQK